MADGDAVTDVVDLSGNGKGVALNVFPDFFLPVISHSLLNASIPNRGVMAYDLDTNEVRVGDGIVPGGFSLASSAAIAAAITGIRPETFGAVGDGVTNDGPAFQALSAVVNVLGGGFVDLSPGKTYIIGGGQTLNPNPHTLTGYAFPPANQFPINFENCPRGVVLRGNGARIRCINGAKYGAFNDDGTPYPSVAPYLEGRVATPYYHMIRASGCKGVHIENLELDGNKQNISLGGQYGDSGWQLAANGIYLENNTGPITLLNVNSHHHCCDGIQINGAADSTVDPRETAVVMGCQFNNNARQSLSLVGGKGYHFISCSFSWTGKDTANSDVLSTLHSAPGAGVDFEAEGGKIIADVLFDNCEFVGNWGSGAIAFGQSLENVKFRGCKYVGTTNSAAYINTSGMEFDGCQFVGLVISAIAPADVAGTGIAFNAPVFKRCFFTNKLTLSPTGALYNLGTPNLIETSALGVHTGFEACRFEHAQAGAISVGAQDISRMWSCMFDVTGAGTLNVFGRFSGRTIFTQTSGTIGSNPLGGATGPFNAKTFAGHAESSWEWRSGGTSTLYPSTITTASVPKGRNQFSDASYTVTVNDNTRPEIIDFVLAPLSADRTVTLSTVGAVLGSRYRILRKQGGVGKLNVGGLINLVAIGSWCEVEFDGGNWILIAAGSLSEGIYGDWANGFFLGDNTRAFRFLESGGTLYMQVGTIGGGATPFMIGGINGVATPTLTLNATAVSIVGTVAASNLSGTNTGDQTITLTGDVTGTGTGSFAATIGNNKVTNAMIRDSAALSVIGNSTNGAADPADIAAGTDGNILRRSGTTLGFGSIDLAAAGTVGTTRLAFANVAQLNATSLAGNSTGGAGNIQNIGLTGGLAFTGTNLTISGAIAPSSVASTGAVTSNSPTAGLGYASGSRGAQTQATSKATGVTSNTVVTDITMNAAALAASTTVSFVFTNSAIGANDTLILLHTATGTFGSYILNAHGFAAGSCTIDVRNISAGSLSEAIVIRAVVIKGG